MLTSNLFSAAFLSDHDQHLRSVIRFYETAFGRNPDADGLQFWVGELVAGLGSTGLAHSFLTSQEFASRYPAAASGDRAAFIQELYFKTLARDPDPEGFSFWMSSEASFADLLAHFAQSAEFTARSEDAISRLLENLSTGQHPDGALSLLALQSDTAGSVADGKIAGATVGIDVNGNGTLDPGEPSTTTDALGNFAFPKGTASGPIIAFGGTDVSTGLPFAGRMEAPEGSKVISPMTTLIKKLADQDQSATPTTQKVLAAQELVKQLFGLSDIPGDLTQLDFVAETVEGDPDGQVDGMSDVQAARVYGLNIQIANLVNQGAAIFEGLEPGLGHQASTSLLFDQIAKLVARKQADEPGAPVQIDSAFVVDVIGETGRSILPQEKHALLDAINTKAADVLGAMQIEIVKNLGRLSPNDTADATREAVIQIVKAQKLVQGEGADAIKSAALAGSTGALDEFLAKSANGGAAGGLNPTLLEAQIIGDVDGDGKVDGGPAAAATPSQPPAPPQPAANQSPVIVVGQSDLNISGAWNGPIGGTIKAIDNDGDPLSFSVSQAGLPTSGTVKFSTNGAFTYTPKPNFAGPDSFWIEVSDGTALTTAQITVTVNGNTPPDLTLNGVNSVGIGLQTGTTLATANQYLSTVLLSLIDDGVGTNQVSLTGADAAVFQFNGSATATQSGTIFDPASTTGIEFVPGHVFDELNKPRYDVSIVVDDPAVGATPDAVASLAVFHWGIPPSAVFANMPVSSIAFVRTVDSFTTVSAGENTNYRIKVGEFTFVDDGIGENVFKIGGPAAQYFELDGTEIFVRKGVALPPTLNAPSLQASVFVYDALMKPALDFTGAQFVPVEVITKGQDPTAADAKASFLLDVGLKAVGNVAPEFTQRSEFALQLAPSEQNVSGQLYGRDANSEPVFFALSKGPSNGQVIVDPSTGLYTYTPNSGFSGVETFVVEVFDILGAATQANAQVIVLPAPVGTPPKLDFPVNQQVLAEDHDTSNDTNLVTFSILDDRLPVGGYDLTLSGADAQFFELQGQDLVLKSGTNLDFETKTIYSVTINVDDPSDPNGPVGFDDSQVFTLSISDVNEPPHFDASAQNLLTASVGAGAINPTGNIHFNDEDTQFAAETRGGQSIVKVQSTGATSHGTLTAYISDPTISDTAGAIAWTFDLSGIDFPSVNFSGGVLDQFYDIYLPDNGIDVKIATVGITLIEA